MTREHKVIPARVGMLELANQLCKVRQARVTELEAQSAQNRPVLTESQFVACENAKHTKEVHSRFGSEGPGCCGAQDTFCVGAIKSVGRVYQQTFVDTYSKVAFAKLYDLATPLAAADLLNDRVLPFFANYDIPLQHVRTDLGNAYCGGPLHHDYELYLAVEDIGHSHTVTAWSRPTITVVERLEKNMLNEFYRVVFRERNYESIQALQDDLDVWLDQYNYQREHPGRWCNGKTPMRTFLDWLELA